jgi:hypothetical protein
VSTITEAMVTIVGLIVAVAIVSVLVSKKAQFPAVLQAAGSAFSNALGVAEAPVTGASYTVDLSYPGTDMSGSFGHA